MSENLKIKNRVREGEFRFKELHKPSDCNIIIPYVPTGYEGYSNTGYLQGQFKIDNFLTYKRVYAGNDAFTINWKGSSSILPKLYEGQIRVDWKLGEYILGFNEGVSSDISIEDDASFSEYKKQIATNTLTFRIGPNYELDENYKYLFYKIPEISKDILYRVVSLETEYEGRLKVGYVLTLQSLQQELENTGKAKSQNVTLTGPGQGWYEPIILNNPKPEDIKDNLNFKQIDEKRWITVDLNRVWNNPCKKVVLKQFGYALTCSFTMVGRKVYKNESYLNYGIPRLIFIYNLVQATTPTLYRTQQSENNFYYAYSLFPTIQFTNEIFKATKDFLDVNKVWPNQGLIYFDKTPANDFRKTNPVTNGKYAYSLFGRTTTIGGTDVYEAWQPALHKDYTVDTRGTFGTEAQYYITKSPRAIHDRMWDTYWVQKQISRLPIREESTITFGSMIGTGALGIINGSPASMITGGIIFGIGLLGSILSQVPNKNMGFGISGIIPCALTDFIIDEASVSLPTTVSNRGFIKLNYFMNEDNQDFTTFFNTQTLNTSFQGELTDLFEKDGVEYETTLIGQTKREDGSLIFGDGRQLLVNGREKLKPINNDMVGFIIDSFVLQAVFKGDFSVEFLDSQDQIIWSGVYQSEAKWTNSIREYVTWRNTSIYGRENTFLEEPKPWPAEIKLAPWGEPKYDINVSSKMREFVLTRGTGGPINLDNIKGAYDGLIEDNFNNTQGPGFRLLGKTYNSGGKPWMKFHNSPQRLEAYKVKDKILSTQGRITKEAFFQAYGNISIKVNMLDQTTEEVVFTPTSNETVDKLYSLSKTMTVGPFLVWANKPADYDVAIWRWRAVTGEVGGRPGTSVTKYLENFGIGQIFNLLSVVNIRHILTFEEDGVYIESIPLEKTLRLEVDYVAMSKGLEEQGNNYKAQLWGKHKHGFGGLYWQIDTYIGLQESIKERHEYGQYPFIDKFSIGRILAKAK